MPSSTNDSRMLRRSFLFEKAQHGNLFDAYFGVSGFSPYLLGDSGYPLLPWLMTPHFGRDHLPVADTLYNKRLRQGGIVENAFGILKQPFRELLTKSDLDVTFLPDVITCCCILHNVMLGQSHADVELLLHILCVEGLDGDMVGGDDDLVEVNSDREHLRKDEPFLLGSRKRSDLGVWLAVQRHMTL